MKVKKTIVTLAVIGGVLWFSRFAHSVVQEEDTKSAGLKTQQVIDGLQTQVDEKQVRIEELIKATTSLELRVSMLKSLVNPEKLKIWEGLQDSEFVGPPEPPARDQIFEARVASLGDSFRAALTDKSE